MISEKNYGGSSVIMCKEIITTLSSDLGANVVIEILQGKDDLVWIGYWAGGRTAGIEKITS